MAKVGSMVFLVAAVAALAVLGWMNFGNDPGAAYRMSTAPAKASSISDVQKQFDAGNETVDVVLVGRIGTENPFVKGKPTFALTEVVVDDHGHDHADHDHAHDDHDHAHEDHDHGDHEHAAHDDHDHAEHAAAGDHDHDHADHDHADHDHADHDHAAHSHDHDDCPFCNSSSAEEMDVTKLAYVKIIDGDGKPAALDAQTALSMKPGDTVYVKGKAKRQKIGYVEIEAEKVHVVR